MGDVFNSFRYSIITYTHTNERVREGIARIRSRITETDIIRFCCRKLPRILKWVRLFSRRRFDINIVDFVVIIIIIISSSSSSLFDDFLLILAPKNKNNCKLFLVWEYWRVIVCVCVRIVKQLVNRNIKGNKLKTKTTQQTTDNKKKKHKQQCRCWWWWWEDKAWKSSVTKSTNEKENDTNDEVSTLNSQ